MTGGNGDLPDGWAATTLGDVCHKPQYGWTTKAVDKPSNMRLLRTTDISKGPIDWPSVPYCAENPPDKEKYKLQSGDLVISRAGSVGLSALIESCPDSVFASYLIRFRAIEHLDRRYVLWFLKSPGYWKQISQESAGIALLNVNAKKLAKLQLPLPPLLEQRRIVAETEKQFTRLDASVAALKRVQVNLKRCRASVLKAACEGRLVPTEAELARAEGRDYERADRLLARILAERRARWESLEKRRGKYKEPVAPDATDLPELPEGWAWTTLDQLATIGTGSTPLTSKSEYYQDGSVPWVTSSALNDLAVSSPSKCVTHQAVEECRLFLYPVHTLLIAMYGEGKTRGKCSELMFPSTINQAIAAVTMEDAANVCRPYCKVFLHGNYEATRRLSSGGVQPNLNLGLIKALAIPLPPLAEQRRIVAEVDRRLSVIDQAEAAVEANITRAERLRQSFLKQAFLGRLVPQDPGDEPASALLKRIRAERETAEAAAKSQRKPRRRGSKSTRTARPKLSEAAR